MKLTLNLMVVLSLAGLIAASGLTLRNGARTQFRKRQAEYPLLYQSLSDDGPRLGIFRDPDSPSWTLDPYMFYDPPTGTTFLLDLPTVEFGAFLILAAMVLLCADACWLCRWYLTKSLHSTPR